MDMLHLMPQVKAAIEEDLCRFCTVSALEHHFNLDRQTLHECFTYEYGHSPKQFIQHFRLQYLRAMIKETGGCEPSK